MTKNFFLFTLLLFISNIFPNTENEHSQNCSCQESLIVKYLNNLESYIKETSNNVKIKSKKLAAQTINKAVKLAYNITDETKKVFNYAVNTCNNMIEWAKDNS